VAIAISMVSLIAIAAAVVVVENILILWSLSTACFAWRNALVLYKWVVMLEGNELMGTFNISDTIVTDSWT